LRHLFDRRADRLLDSVQLLQINICRGSIDMKSRSECYEEGRQVFKTLSAETSGIRGISEAVRQNEAGGSDPAAANAFERGLQRAIERVGSTAKRLAGSKHQ